MLSKKTIIIAVAVLIAVALLTTISLVVIRGLNTKTSQPQNEVAVSAATVISEFGNELSNGTAIPDTTYNFGDAASTQLLYVLDSSNSKFVQVSTSNLIIINKADGFSVESLENATSKVTAFLQGKGFTKQDGPDQKSILASYGATNATCQLNELAIVDKATTEIRLLCADNYASTLADINSLLGLWAAGSSANYDVVLPQTNTQGAYVITILKALPADLTKGHVLVYVKEDGTQKFIGDAGEGTAVEPNERFIINKDIKTGFDNPQYGAALKAALKQL